MNRLCKNCVNFLSHKKDICFCDYEYWDETEYCDAILNVPEMFDCDKFEPITKIVQGDWKMDRTCTTSKFNRKY